MPDSIDVAVAGLSARQAGLFSRAQVLRRRGTDHQIAHRLRVRRWQQWTDGVYLLSGVPPHPDRTLWGGLLRAGANAVVLGRSAAHLLNFDGFERPMPEEINVPHPGRRDLRGVRVRQLGDLAPHHTGRLRGMPVTTPARTVLDLSADLGAARVVEVARQLVIDGRLQPARLSRLLSEIVRPGKRGLPSMMEVVDSLAGGYVVSGSVLERLALPLIVAAGVGGPVPQHPHPANPAWRCDFALVPPKVLIEADGRTWHARYQQMRRDHERDQRAAAVGWLTLRFGWEQITDDPDSVTAAIRLTCQQRLDSVA